MFLEKNDSVIRDAVLREMERGGQVYYLYNKVDTIDRKVSELQELVRSFDWVCSRTNEQKWLRKHFVGLY